MPSSKQKEGITSQLGLFNKISPVNEVTAHPVGYNSFKICSLVGSLIKQICKYKKCYITAHHINT
jgi:hypothetical protein